MVSREQSVCTANIEACFSSDNCMTFIFFFSALSPSWMIKVCCRSGQRCASPLRSFILSALYTESTYHDIFVRDMSHNGSIGSKQF